MWCRDKVQSDGRTGYHFSLRRRSCCCPAGTRPAPRRAQLEAGLRDSVRSGRLRPGVRLPSSRALGIELGVSRRLVVEAYEQLTAEGYLVSLRGSGTRVAPARARTAIARGRGPAAAEPTMGAVPVPRRAASRRD